MSRYGDGAQPASVASRWMPLWSLLGWLLAWEVLVRLAGIPHYTLPAPSLVVETLFANFGSLAGSWWFTLKITLGALSLAVLGGVFMAAAFSLSPRLEAVALPLAVVLQVTPIVAIAPLMLIYIDSTTAARASCSRVGVAGTADARGGSTTRNSASCEDSSSFTPSAADSRRATIES